MEARLIFLTLKNYHSMHFSFLFIGWESATWPANNFQIIGCSCVVPPKCIVLFRLIYERWADECLTVLTEAMIRARNRRWWTIARSPYAWSVPRPVKPWFDLHYFDVTVPGDVFRQQLRVTKNSFNRVFNILGHRLVRPPSRLRDPLPSEKILALGLYRPGHGDSYVSIGLSFHACYSMLSP